MVKEFLNKKIICDIKDNKDVIGVLVEYNGNYYILNDVTKANNNTAKKHYKGKYNYKDDYCIGNGSEEFLKLNKISNIRLFLKSSYELW